MQGTSAAVDALNLPEQVFDYGWRCDCRGAIDGLTIDHVRGNRGDISGTQFHRWPTNNGFPGGYRTLFPPMRARVADWDAEYTTRLCAEE